MEETFGATIIDEETNNEKVKRGGCMKERDVYFFFSLTFASIVSIVVWLSHEQSHYGAT